MSEKSKKRKKHKVLEVLIDLLMYIFMLLQMIYVFTGNLIHEWIGMGFFVCLLAHIYIKRKWFTSFYKRKGKGISARRVADLLIILLLICVIILMLSSMDVSRTLFPNVHIWGSANFHWILATLALMLSVAHGAMHGYFVAKRKKRMAMGILLCVALAGCLGFYMVPYLNRHFRTVEIDGNQAITGKQMTWKASEHKPLVVYFTRLGNTDFEEDIDAVSGASLLKIDGEMMGNTELLAKMLTDIIECDLEVIQLTGEKYPSSYAETCSIAGKEKKEGTRPQIAAMDLSDYDSIILVYPIWWYTIPMPVATFLENHDFTGKTVYLLATQGSQGFASSTEDVKKMIPTAHVEEAISIYCDDIPEARQMIVDWLQKKKLAE